MFMFMLLLLIEGVGCGVMIIGMADCVALAFSLGLHNNNKILSSTGQV